MDSQIPIYFKRLPTSRIDILRCCLIVFGRARTQSTLPAFLLNASTSYFFRPVGTAEAHTALGGQLMGLFHSRFGSSICCSSGTTFASESWRSWERTFRKSHRWRRLARQERRRTDTESCSVSGDSWSAAETGRRRRRPCGAAGRSREQPSARSLSLARRRALRARAEVGGRRLTRVRLQGLQGLQRLQGLQGLQGRGLQGLQGRGRVRSAAAPTTKRL